MLMPKTAVHENHLPPTGKNEIWLARKIFSMKAEAVTETMDETS
jgi:hypothetical protein